MPSLTCPVCHHSIEVDKIHHQKMPQHMDKKGQPCRGVGREPIYDSSGH